MIYKTSNESSPFPIRTRRLLTGLELPTQLVKPTFLYSIHNVTEPSWHISIPNIDMEMAIYKKANTPSAIYKTEFFKLLETHPEYETIYTDGPKTIAGVGAAAVHGNTVKTLSLPDIASIFTAELQALNLAITLITRAQTNAKRLRA